MKLHLSGGEPLIQDSIFYRLSLLEHHFEDVGITTNGTMIKKRIDEIDKLSRRVNFNISLDTISVKVFNDITKKDMLKEVIEGIDLILKNGLNCKINTVVLKKTIKEIQDILKFAKDRDIIVKFLDLISDDKNEITSTKEIYCLLSAMFNIEKTTVTEGDTDYICNGSKVRLQNRLYGEFCNNCNKFPCGEGYFCIRVFGNGV